MPPLSRAEAQQYARDAGFTGQSVAEIAAVAEAESGLDPIAHNATGNHPEDSVDRGVLQFNSHWHPEVSDACAYDPACAFRAAYTVSNGGKDFGSWVATSTSRYQQALAQHLSVLNPIPSGPDAIGPVTNPGEDVPLATGGGFQLPGVQGIADAITAATQPIRDFQDTLGRSLWTAAFVGLGMLMIGAGVLIYMRPSVIRASESVADTIGAGRENDRTREVLTGQQRRPTV